MPIISTIGRKTFKVRFLIISMYVVLLLGSTTMIYPFLLMIAGSTKSGMDTPESEIIPRFLTNDDELYKKGMEAFFNESFEMLQVTYANYPAISFRKLASPEKIDTELTAKWRYFITENDLPTYYYGICALNTTISRKVMPSNLRRFKSELIEKYDGSIDLMNREMGTEFVDWNSFYVIPTNYLSRLALPREGAMDKTFRDFKKKLPLESRSYFSPDGFYKAIYLKSQYTKDLDNYNEKHDTQYKSWNQIHLSRNVPASGLEREDWLRFVRNTLNMLWISADKQASGNYRRFLEAKYKSIEGVNRNYSTNYSSFEEIEIIDSLPKQGLILSDWNFFIQGWKDPDSGETHQLPNDMITIKSIDFMFRDYLKKEYGTLAGLNKTCGTNFSRWIDIIPPQREFNYLNFATRKGALRWEFVKRNYISVIDYIVLHGRGILNTFIYCAMAILCALIVNPIAAYALSRYKPPSAYKLLLFLMLTMAFPPMVTQIPVFLLLRELTLLNTFWALILPGLANGYLIFLLKGFFDSLPQELYESAELDGAGEFRIFFQITMSLSKPILAVIALDAFRMAYSNFMMALLICQDEKMWTLMPWLYQLQQQSCQGIVFTSLIIAAIPTFIVFALCQNVIMRGIVVPVEK